MCIKNLPINLKQRIATSLVNIPKALPIKYIGVLQKEIKLCYAWKSLMDHLCNRHDDLRTSRVTNRYRYLLFTVTKVYCLLWVVRHVKNLGI